MGLDTVELVLAIEDHFKIDIPDRVAETITSVGQMHDFVVAELHRQDRFELRDDEVFRQLQALIVYQLGVKPEQVVPSARFVDDLHID